MRNFVKLKRFIPLLAAPLLWVAGSSVSYAGELLDVSGTLAVKGTIRHPLDITAGKLVTGTLTGPTMRLVLFDGRGEVVRRLAIGNGLARQDFAFVAAGQPPFTLEVRAPVAGDYRLQARTASAPSRASASAAALASPTLQKLQTALQAGADHEAFWQAMQQQGMPLIENEFEGSSEEPGKVLLTFVYRGAQSGVLLLGAPAAGHEPLLRLGDSDIWYRSYVVPRTLRLSYRFAPDAPAGTGRTGLLAVARRDPLNPASFPAKPLDAFSGESVVELADAPPKRWLRHDPDIQAGSVSAHRIDSALLANQRQIRLYRPPGYTPDDQNNGLLVLFDGERQDSAAMLATILDNLHASGRIRPTAAILVSNADRDSRSRELPPNPLFARFLAEELLPWARAQGIAADAKHTVAAGASFGGLAASWAALSYPQHFGNVYAQSGSYWWHPQWDQPGSTEEPGWLMRDVASRPRVPVRWHLEAGRYESGGSKPILETVRHFRDVLQARGYTVSHREFDSGHDPYNWFITLGDGLALLLAR